MTTRPLGTIRRMVSQPIIPEAPEPDDGRPSGRIPKLREVLALRRARRRAARTRLDNE